MANANKQLLKDHSFKKIGKGEEVDFFRNSWQQLPKLLEEGDLLIHQVHLEMGRFTKVKYFWKIMGELAPLDSGS